ncbi:hypothetical protein BDQ17DRAFT_885335 [Cyathus striatus]|nr:hypothetical protein BDQ17DRAFT_885335 [Cyathus striatus]
MLYHPPLFLFLPFRLFFLPTSPSSLRSISLALSSPIFNHVNFLSLVHTLAAMVHLRWTARMDVVGEVDSWAGETGKREA